MRRAILAVIVGAVLAVLTALPAGAAGAAQQAAAPQAVGSITFFHNDSTVTRISYQSCASPLRVPLRTPPRLYDNQPLDGCRVLLFGGFRSIELLPGRHRVPPPFDTTATHAVITTDAA